jgi:putative ATPase
LNMSKKIKGFEDMQAPGRAGELFPGGSGEPREEPGDGPLADRMRPDTLEQFVGQEPLMGEGAVLRRMIEEDRLTSLIFWGPPGSGKTTLARIIAHRTGAWFQSYSAVLSGSKEMKEVMARARESRRATGRRTILFVDEVHRFNKAQQDAFLPYVESGDVVLIGATTENPSFEVNSALLSRSKVFVFSPIDPEGIGSIVKRALETDPQLASGGLSITDEALSQVVAASDGDARRALNALELSSVVAGGREGEKGSAITAGDVEKALGGKSLAYDKSGEEHYNIISALHKSVRGSDPDASIYWLVRMMEAGEDRRYLLRRLTRMAVEDVGLASPAALSMAAAARDAFDLMGEPEGDLVLVQLTVYLAMAPKSNALYRAHKAAVRDVQGAPAHQVPLHIRNAPTGLMKDLGYGKGYEYSHDMPEGVSAHSFFPEEMGDRVYYRPTEEGHEKTVKERLKEIRDKVRTARASSSEGKSGREGEGE